MSLIHWALSRRKYEKYYWLIPAVFTALFLSCSAMFSKKESINSPTMTHPQSHYPNAYLKLEWTKKIPSCPEQSGIIEIWLREKQFRVRDATGRFIYEILSDVNSASGLGYLPSTMEEIMDISDRARDTAQKKVIEFWGNIDSNKAWVREAGVDVRSMEVNEIKSIPAQVLQSENELNLSFIKNVELFNNKCNEYRAEISDESKSYKTQLTYILHPPFILFKQAQDVENEAIYQTHKVVVFQEGSVTPLVVQPPST